MSKFLNVYNSHKKQFEEHLHFLELVKSEVDFQNVHPDEASDLIIYSMADWCALYLDTVTKTLAARRKERNN